MKLFIFALAFFISQLALAEVVVVKTNQGTFEIELDEEKAPISVKNFLSYVDSNFYYGTIFHRAVKDFVVQGGGLTPAMYEKPTYLPIQSEATNGLSNLKGTIAMARTNDVNSATSQFYINTVDNLKLDHSETKHGYAVFGKIISGYEVIEIIEIPPVHTVGEYSNVPKHPIIIESIKRK